MSIKIPFSTHENLKKTVDRVVAGGVADPEVAKAALERLSRDREELRKKIGTVDVAVQLVREVRDE